MAFVLLCSQRLGGIDGVPAADVGRIEDIFQPFARDAYHAGYEEDGVSRHSCRLVHL